MSSTVRFLISALLLSVSSLAEAAVIDRRSRDEPEIVVEAGGRVGRTDMMLFSGDGKWLLCAGDDKVVRMWPYADGKLDTTKGKARVLRWPAWREQRGGIKALAVNHDASRVLVGGFGMRSSTVALLDGESGDLLALTYPHTGKKGENYFSVMTVALPKDPKQDKRVAFATADGSVWVWDTTPLPNSKGKPLPERTARPVRVGVHERPENIQNPNASKTFSYPRDLWFEGEALFSINETGQILKCEIPSEFPETVSKLVSEGEQFFNVTAGLQEGFRVFRAARTRDNEWMVLVPQLHTLVFRHLTRKDNAKAFLKLPDRLEIPYCAAFEPKTGHLAVGVSRSLRGPEGFLMDGKGRVLVWENPLKPHAKIIADISISSFPDAVAFHPTDGKLAIAAGDDSEIFIYDVDKPKHPTSMVRGAGRGLWSVGLSPNGNVLGVQTQRDSDALHPNKRGTGTWHAFDLPRMKPTKEPAEWLGPVSTADGWEIEQDKKDQFVWHAIRKGDQKADNILEIDRRHDMMPTCFTFIPATETTPTRILVGHYYGISLFERTPSGFVRTRVFVGHAGEVTSVVAAKDGTWFVSTGTDQTVAAWSLNPWPSQPSLGANFAVEDGKLVVKKVDAGSPAWELGLTAGDTIETLAIKSDLIHNTSPKYPKKTDLEEAKRRLGIARAGVEHYIGYRRQGKGDIVENLTTVRQRPLWKWFPAFDDDGKLTDWIIWMWRGSYYHTKTAHGDRLVGWHVNHPQIDGKPEFYQLQQFEKQYHRPELLTKLIATRDLTAVMVAALGENPQSVPFDRFEPAPVRLAFQKTTVGEGGLTVGVNVAARGTNPDLLPDRVELWVNDYRHKVWETQGKSVEEIVDLPPDVFRGGDNQIAVQTFNRVGGRGEAMKIVTNPRAPADPRILGLSVGINNYAAHRVNAAGARSFDDLRSARSDAEKIAESVLAYRGDGKYFPSGDFNVRLDAAARRKDLLETLDKFAKEAKADDHLVVFFAGHGDFVMPSGGDTTGPGPDGARGVGGSRGLFLFCCPDYAPAKPQQTALAAEELFDKIATIKCRKMILLDACHSGQATEANLIRRFVPNGQGPFVMASSDQSELSYEHPKFGHGLFTYAVMEALGDRFRKADRDTDGNLTTAELYRYVADRVPALLKEAGKDPGLQNPICFPRGASASIFVKR